MAACSNADADRKAGEAVPDDMRAGMIDLCARRERTYELLARLFGSEVDAQTYESLKGASFPARTGDERIDTGYRKIASYLSGDHDDAVLQLAVDYVRVFIGHGNTAYSAAYPFESVYTSEKRLLMQEARDEILRCYAEAGLVIAPAWKEPEDHLSLELEYMQIMSRRAKEALEAKRDDEALGLVAAQRDFLCAHLTSWVPMMTSDMRRFARTDFYLGLSYLTEGFLASDRAFLKSVVSEGEEGAHEDS